MCGIAGVLALDGTTVDPVLVERMNQLQAHRGPDDAGVLAEGAVAFGHRRLSIVDLSAAGHQPMVGGDGSYWIVYNGEIYNHEALRRELCARGHRFRSRSDTEVILAAYAEWGEGCVARFEGMWAFAIRDWRRSLLFCSRDRLGIKPFHYAHGSRRFVFASEAKAVLAACAQLPAPNFDVLRLLLLYRSRIDPAQTSFAGVQQLAPGHNLVLAGERLRIARYWSVDEHPMQEESIDLATMGRALRERLDAAVQSHLAGDVPVAAALSGGLDSSVLVAIAARRSRQPLHTYSVLHPGTAADESPFVAAVTTATPELRSRSIVPGGGDLAHVMQCTTWHFEEPTWGSSVHSWWHLMQLAGSAGTKVLLNGQGADELFAGYPRYRLTLLRELLIDGRIGEFRRELAATSQHERLSGATLLRDLATPYWPRWSRRGLRRVGFGRAYDSSMFGPQFAVGSEAPGAALARRAFHRLDHHLRSDLQATRLPELLQAEDRFSMAFSIESRVPYLDRELVEFALALPTRFKLGAGITKRVLREAIRGELPAMVVDRADKLGYATPADDWLRGSAREWVDELLHSRRLRERGWFDPQWLTARYRGFQRGEHRMPELWSCLSTEIWCRQYLDTPTAQWDSPRRVPVPAPPRVGAA